jgi:hypothetical protein
VCKESISQDTMILRALIGSQSLDGFLKLSLVAPCTRSH